MANNPVRRTETGIDPTFYIPEGVDELFYDDPTSLGYSIDEGDDTTDGDVTEDSGQLPAPDSFKIISQKVHTQKGGARVVDIVAEVETIKGAVKYEVRITKA